MIRCPHCSHDMQVKGLHAGNFHPRCPKCGKSFSITLQHDGDEPVVAADTVLPLATSSSRSRTTAAPSHLTRSARETIPPAPTPIVNSPSGADTHTLREAPKVYQQSVGRLSQPTPPGISPMLTGRLGGYELKRKLGQGGMGTVYLARQVSLDRDVAVKVLDPTLGDDAQFVSRFVREAYAAAQLVHHNVVQIHDIGQEQQTHFYSMEFVKGQSLADVIRTEGAIAPDVAAGYILQAARGLKLAHDQGMIHRDIKPENLLLSADGVVKVADLGLVKRRTDDETLSTPEAAPDTARKPSSPTATLARSAMGTPAYMAPEQAEDAARVDARADIYSLGCTLYAMLTGRAPFRADSAEKILELARTRDIPAPKSVNERVPSDLSRITRLMTARRREDRYANIGLVIRELETYLGVEAGGSFSPRQQHVEELETCVKQFNDSTMARLRNLAVRALVIFGVFLAAILAWNGQYTAAVMTFATLLTSTALYQVIVGISGHSHLACRLRQLAMGARWRDWGRWAATAALGLLAIFALDIVGSAILVFVISLAIAATVHFLLDALVRRQRHSSLARAQDMLRGFRLKGLDEDAVRRFVCEYAGRQWEEFYEALFGYEAKLEARKRWGRSARGYDRPKHAAWRDPIVRWIDHREEARRQEKQRKHLLRVETRALQAQGVEEVAAAKQARRVADLMYAQAQELRGRAINTQDAAATLPPGADPAVQKPRPAFRLDADAKVPVHITGNYVSRRYGGPTEMIFGPRMRFALAVVLLLGFLTWRYQNREAIVSEIQQLQGFRVDPVLQDPTRAIDTRKVVEVATYTTQPLQLFFLPQPLANLLGTWNAGVAGLILLIGSFVRSLRVGIPLLVAAAIVLFGHFLPIMDRAPASPPVLAILIGSAIALIALVTIKREPAL